MKRALTLLALATAVVLAGCTGGGSSTTPGGTTAGPLALQLFAASPNSGPSPLLVTLTTNISGGTAPYTYAFDFENDGAFDDYINASFNQTVSAQHQYFLRAADVGGSSTYTTIVKVTDSKGVTLTSDPLTITVTGGTSFAINPDPTQTFVYSNEQDDNGNYIFRSGQPVFFRVGLIGGAAPFSYQWDFDNNGTVDSTVPNPQFIYTNNDIGFKPFVAQLRVTEGGGGQAFWSYAISVEGKPIPSGEQKQFVVLLNSNPPQVNGMITVRFDPTGQTPGTPKEPELDLAAAVSSDPTKSGRAPYEFYWDFENDGKIDVAAQSPTIPYYDSTRKITVNPYLHNLAEESYTLRLLAIDSAGNRVTVLRTIRSINVAGRPPDVLSVAINYGFGSPVAPYVVTPDRNTNEVSNFTIQPSGSTGIYEYQIDVDGDGTYDIPSGGGFTALPKTGLTVPVNFGPWDADSNPATPDTTDWPEPGYYAVQINVRALNVAGGTQVDHVLTQVPVSMVVLGVDESLVDANPATPAVIDGSLPKVQDHAMVGFAATGAGGGNGTTLIDRGVIVTGGTRGTAALRDVFRITENFTPPVNAGDIETRNGNILYSPRVPMTQARRGHAAFLTANPDVVSTDNGCELYVVAGRNVTDGPLSSVEFQLYNDPNSTNTWTVSGTELRLGGQRYPLYDFGYTPFWNVPAAPAMPAFLGLCTGGLNQDSIGVNANVSGDSFLLYTGNANDADPTNDQFGDTGRGLRIPRYEISMVVVGSTVYAIGGRISTGESTRTVESVDLSQAGSVWREIASLHDARSGSSAVAIDPDGPAGAKPAEIYVYGGAYFPGTGTARTLVNTAEVFDTKTGVWTYTAPLPDHTNTSLLASPYNGAIARLPGPGSVGATSLFNSAWYYGGEGDQVLGTSRESNYLQEFTYFYSVP